MPISRTDLSLASYHFVLDFSPKTDCLSLLVKLAPGMLFKDLSLVLDLNIRQSLVIHFCEGTGLTQGGFHEKDLSHVVWLKFKPGTE